MDTGTIQFEGYWNYISWRILELYKLEDTGTIAGGYWNYSSWRILELYKLDDTGTIEAGGYWNYTSWRILELYKLENTGAIQAGGYWNYASWRILELYKLEDTGAIQAGGTGERVRINYPSLHLNLCSCPIQALISLIARSDLSYMIQTQKFIILFNFQRIPRSF